jgi:hypothetical protein
MTLSQRGYAAHRRRNGLPGGTPRAVQKALLRGRIELAADGRIDPEQADAQWLNQTSVRKSRAQRQGSQPAKNRVAADQRDFQRGAAWIAQQVASTARRLWPAVVAGLNLDLIPEDRREGMRGLLVTLMVSLLESWTQDYLTPGDLPNIDWTVFGSEAGKAQSEFEELRAAWAKP